MKNMDIIENLNITYDDSKTALMNLYNMAILFLEKTDPENKISTRIIQHTLRSMKIADRIMKKELADRTIVMCSLLLHDLGKTLTESRHDLVSYDLAIHFLKYTKIPEEKQKKILDCILYHSAKNLKSLDLTIEQKVVMDADILDEIGILSIVKYCLKCNKNKDIDEIIKHMDDVYTKIDKETVYLQTKYGKELYAQKKKKYREIMELFRLEAGMYNIK